jgi:hypothetical protein
VYEQGSGDQLREKGQDETGSFGSSLEGSLRTSETCKFAVKLFDLMMVIVIPDRNTLDRGVNGWKEESEYD